VTRKENQQHFSKEELDRILQKQAEHEVEIKKETNKQHEDRLRAKWIMQKSRHEFPNTAIDKIKRVQEERREDLATAKLEARDLQRSLEHLRLMERREIIKQGVMKGAIKIHETEHGFEIDTPPEEVDAYIHFNRGPSKANDLRNGCFLLSSVSISSKEEVKLLREFLIAEYEATSPSDLMLIDLIVSNYYRAMYATQMEMESILYADQYRMEMFEANATGVQPYINACQNQFLKTLRALKSSKEKPLPHITYQAFTKTDINLQSWGLPLLQALEEITEKKEENIDVDEIKQTMTKYATGYDTTKISNAHIGYALRDYGLTSKTHTTNGNQYSISKQQVHQLLNEVLKG
jgi:hypothetical protein